MIKVFDSTIISAMDNEITSLKLYPIIASKYSIIISEEVSIECKNHFKEKVQVFTTSDTRFKNACEYMHKRFEGLGPGERTSIIVSIFLSENKIANYLITDDFCARKKIQDIHNDIKLTHIIGHEIEPIKFAGTVGMVLKTYNNGHITLKEMHDIADNLENSSFRISPELLKLLRS